MKLLTISDVELGIVYSPQIKQRFKDVDLVLSCGDLSYSYLEYIISSLDAPLFYVRGNHTNQVEETVAGPKTKPEGGIDLHGRVFNHAGLLLAGVEGCVQYNYGPYQYSQETMWGWVLSLVPGMMLNRLRYGRFLDIFITHAPPAGIHDMEDKPHQGIKAFNWLDRVFKPRYHFHGHTHVYHNTSRTVTRYHQTTVINTYGYKETRFENSKSNRMHTSQHE
ncbi:MAG: metallophosphoesterase [Anaerolinea sp.]|nr:metallophosphoesterase [Anaerolinea sp.]